jgi:hypothetical protein
METFNGGRKRKLESKPNDYVDVWFWAMSCHDADAASCGGAATT